MNNILPYLTNLNNGQSFEITIFFVVMVIMIYVSISNKTNYLSNKNTVLLIIGFGIIFYLSSSVKENAIRIHDAYSGIEYPLNSLNFCSDGANGMEDLSFQNPMRSVKNGKKYYLNTQYSSEFIKRHPNGYIKIVNRKDNNFIINSNGELYNISLNHLANLVYGIEYCKKEDEKYIKIQEEEIKKIDKYTIQIDE